MEEKRAVLIYQAGIANVFEVECFNTSNFGRNARRMLQADFRTCEAYARGLADAGWLVCSLACNQAGDISGADWTNVFEDAPFSDSFRPVFRGVLTPSFPPQ